MAITASVQMAKIQLKYEKIIPEFLKSKDFYETAVEATKNFVKNRRLGKTAGFTGDALKPFGELTENYVKVRKRYSSNLSQDTKSSRKKSNATATGQMLDSATPQITDSGFIIKFEGSRSQDLTGHSSPLSNAKVAEYFGDRRPFAFFAKSEVSALIRTIRQQLVERYNALNRS